MMIDGRVFEPVDLSGCWRYRAGRMWTPNLKIIRLIRMSQLFANHRLARLGLSSGLYYFVLELLDGQTMTMSDLSAAVGVDNGHCSRAVERLVALGYVKRRRDRADRRTLHVQLTRKGREAGRQVSRVVREWVDIIHQGIDPGEVAVATSVIDRYHDNAMRTLGNRGEAGGTRQPASRSA